MLLREELGSSPGATLVALHEQLLRDDPAAAPQPAPRAGQAEGVGLAGRARPRGRAAGHAARGGDRGRGPRGADRGPARDRQVAADGRVPAPRDRRRRARAQRARGRARARVPVRRRPPAVRGRRRATRTRWRAPPRRRGSSSQSPDENGSAGGDASFAALHGLYWLALNLAAERPLLLEVDDLHWCDRPSLRFLAYLVRRLEGQPVLVTASRPHRRPADRRRAAGRDRQRSRDRPRPPGAARARRRSARSSPAGSAPSPTARSARPATGPPAATRCSSASS